MRARLHTTAPFEPLSGNQHDGAVDDGIEWMFCRQEIFFGGRLFATSYWLTESKKLRRSASIMRRSCARADSLRGSRRISSTRRFNLHGWIGSSKQIQLTERDEACTSSHLSARVPGTRPSTKPTRHTPIRTQSRTSSSVTRLWRTRGYTLTL